MPKKKKEETKPEPKKKRGRPKKEETKKPIPKKKEKNTNNKKDKKPEIDTEAYDKIYGKGTIMGGSGFIALRGKPKKEDYINSGSLNENYHLSGSKDFGYLRGSIIEFYGMEQSGKTTGALHAAVETTKNKEKVFFIDGEGALDLSYAERIGVDLDYLFYTQTNCIEEAMEISYEMIIKEKISLLIIDSVPSLRPRAEIEGSVDDQFMALHARIMGRWVTKINGLTSKKTAETQWGKKDVTVIYLNQIRHKVGVFFGSPETTPGGFALRFFARYRNKYSKASSNQKMEETSVVDFEENSIEKKSITGIFSKVYIEKNKLYPPYKTFFVPLKLGKGYDKKLDMLAYMESIGIVEYKAGNKTAKLLGKGIKLDVFFDKLKNDKEFKKAIKKHLK